MLTCVPEFDFQNQCKKPGMRIQHGFPVLRRWGQMNSWAHWPARLADLERFGPLRDPAWGKKKSVNCKQLQRSFPVFHTCTNLDTRALLHNSVYVQRKNPRKNGQLEFTRMMWHTHDLVNSRMFLWTLSMEFLKFQITCHYIMTSLGSLAKVGLSLSHSWGSLPPSLLLPCICHKAEFPARNTFGTMSYSQGGLHR